MISDAMAGGNYPGRPAWYLLPIRTIPTGTWIERPGAVGTFSFAKFARKT